MQAMELMPKLTPTHLQQIQKHRQTDRQTLTLYPNLVLSHRLDHVQAMPWNTHTHTHRQTDK